MKIGTKGTITYGDGKTSKVELKKILTYPATGKPVDYLFKYDADETHRPFSMLNNFFTLPEKIVLLSFKEDDIELQTIIKNSHMITINKITEPTCELYLNGEIVGEITGHLQLNDCLIQIFRDKLEGYYIIYDGEKYPIRSDGRIIGGREIYPLFTEQMKEILGF